MSARTPFKLKEIAFLLLDQQNKVDEGSIVVVEQIGDNNDIYSLTFTGKSELRIFQHGNGNIISLLANAKNLEGKISQNGNNNYSFDFAQDPDQELNINLLQKGNNHHFERYGSNSIGNDLQFKMEGESQTIIVRNFK